MSSANDKYQCRYNGIKLSSLYRVITFVSFTLVVWKYLSQKKQTEKTGGPFSEKYIFETFRVPCWGAKQREWQRARIQWNTERVFISFSATQSTVMEMPRRQQMAWPLWPIWGVWRVEISWFLADLNHNAQVSGTFPPRYALTKIKNIGKNTPKGSMTRAPCFKSVTCIIANAAVVMPQATVNRTASIIKILQFTIIWSSSDVLLIDRIFST